MNANEVEKVLRAFRPAGPSPRVDRAVIEAAEKAMAQPVITIEEMPLIRLCLDLVGLNWLVELLRLAIIGPQKLRVEYVLF